nr:MAG TPA: hypothetical protein [Caudoviricetes sp.]
MRKEDIMIEEIVFLLIKEKLKKKETYKQGDENLLNDLVYRTKLIYNGKEMWKLNNVKDIPDVPDMYIRNEIKEDLMKIIKIAQNMIIKNYIDAPITEEKLKKAIKKMNINI